MLHAAKEQPELYLHETSADVAWSGILKSVTEFRAPCLSDSGIQPDHSKGV